MGMMRSRLLGGGAAAAAAAAVAAGALTGKVTSVLRIADGGVSTDDGVAGRVTVISALTSLLAAAAAGKRKPKERQHGWQMDRNAVS